MNIKLTKKKVLLLLHSAIVLGISYAIVLCFGLNTTKFLSFFGVIDETGDVPMSDMYFNFEKLPLEFDTTITIVNIGLCSDRLEIAKIIKQIDSLNPKVIGLDVFFEKQKEPKIDSVLKNVILNCKKIVIPCKLKDERSEDKDKYNKIERNFFVYEAEENNFNEGFVNADGKASDIIRTFTPILFLQKEKSLDTIYNFATQVVKLYDKEKIDSLLKRPKNNELINFKPIRIKKIDIDEIKDYHDRITDKIVLIGSLLEDTHQTPTLSQMNGTEIYAYIISGIIAGKYTNRLDNIWTKLMNFLLCYLFTIFCWIVATKIKRGGSFFTKLTQVAILIVAFFAGRSLFNYCNIDIDYTRTIIVMGVVILIVDIYHICIIWGSKWIFKRKKTNQNEENNI